MIRAALLVLAVVPPALAAERKAQRERGVRGLLTDGAKAAADFMDRLRGRAH